ncbi:MAG: hypothetical protein ACFCVH_13875 [Alphaproteobacteria bacterium]
MANYRPQIRIGPSPQAPVVQAPRSDPAAAGGWGRGLQQVGAAGREFLDERLTEVRAGDLAILRAQTVASLEGFAADLARDPNASEASATNWLASHEQQVLDGIADPVVQAAFRPNLAAMTILAGARARQTVQGRMDDRNVAALTTATHALSNAAAQAQTPEQRQFFMDEIAVMAGEYIEAGTLSEAGAVRFLQESFAELDGVRVSQAMRANPGVALQMLNDPAVLPHLSAGSREAFTAQAERAWETHLRSQAAGARAAANADADALEEAAALASREMRTRIALGETITPQEFRDIAPLLGDSEFGRLVSAYEGQHDPQEARIYTTLDASARNAQLPEMAFMAMLNQALESDVISPDQYDSFRSLRLRSVTGDTPPTVADLTADSISRGLQPGPFDILTDRGTIEARRRDALIEFYATLDQSPNMSPSEIQQLGDRLIERYSGDTLSAPQASAGPSRPPGAAAWAPETVTTADVQAVLRARLAFYVDQLGDEDAAYADPRFVAELTALEQWAAIAAGRN